MAKRKQPRFMLSAEATKKLDKQIAEIRKGIKNICEMHTHDSNPSMTQVEFEKLFIDKILGQPITALSASLRAMADGLSAQKEVEAEKIKQSNINPEEETEESI